MKTWVSTLRSRVVSQHSASIIVTILIVLGLWAYPVSTALAAPLAPALPTISASVNPAQIDRVAKTAQTLSAIFSAARNRPAASVPAIPQPAPFAAIAATTTVTVSIFSTPYATRDSNLNKILDPSVWVVEAVITNTTSTPVITPVVGLDMNPVLGNWYLLPGETSRRDLAPIPANGVSTVFWFAHRSDTVPDPHTYTVTVSGGNINTVTQHLNAYPVTSFPPQTVESRSSQSTGNTGILSTGANVVVGAPFTITVDYDMGVNPLGVTVQPNGTYTKNGSIVFNPGAYRLLSNTVQFRNSANSILTPTYQNRLYFPDGSLPPGAKYVRTTYTFLPRLPQNAVFCPYTDVSFSGGPKYDQFYCDSTKFATINVTGSLSISFTKSVSAATIQQGQILTYTFNYTNNGTIRVENAYIWDDIPANTSVSSVNPITDSTPGFNTPTRAVWSIGSINPGASGVVTMAVRVDGGGHDILDGTQLVNKGYFGILFEPGAVPAVTSTVTTTVLAPTVSTSKNDDQTNVIQGQVLTYTLRVTNTGTAPVSNAVVTDVLPLGVTYAGGASPAPLPPSGQTLVWNVGTVGSNSGVTITIPVTVNYRLADDARLTNTLDMRYFNPSGYLYVSQTATDIDVVQSPVLTITKRSAPNPALTGRVVTYTLNVTNTGPADATNVIVTDVVPISTTYVTCSPVGACGLGAGNVVSWTLPLLGANSSTIVTMSVQLASNLTSGAAINNQTYGVLSTQTAYVAGALQQTIVRAALAKVIGRAFIDANVNGTQDGIEGGIPGVTVTLLGPVSVITTTDASGYYTFALEQGGDISVDANLPSGYFRTTTSPVYLSVTLETTTTVDFGYNARFSGTSAIIGTVFHDRNHNGVQELGENGLSGVSIASSPGANTSPVTTNNYGQYTLGYTAGGTYTVTETNPDIYVSTTPDTKPQFVALNDSALVNFGDFLGIRIEGKVFDDQNVDGALDGLEAGIPGVTVSSGYDITTTYGAGNYVLFSTVVAGQPVTITETDLGGYVSTAAIPGDSRVIRIDTNTLRVSTPTSGQYYLNNNFGDVLAASVISITGQIFNDANANGVPDDGGSGLPNGRVSVNTGMYITTTSSGNFTLYAPPSTVVTVTETNPPGYVSTNAIPGTNAVKYDLDTLRIDALSAGAASSNNYFGDVFPSSAAIITGVLFNDADNNGLFGSGEGVFSGEVVQISGTDSLITTTTGSNGAYQFAVGAGNFLVTSSKPTGYYRTTPDQWVVSAALGAIYPDRNFGFSNNLGLTNIYGTVFNDYNGDGYQGLGELGLQNATVYLISGTTIISNVTTGPDGTYSFPITQPGPYTVFEANPPGYFSTTPDQINVVVSLGTSQQVNFGDSNRSDVGSVHGIVFNDLNANGVQDPNEPGIGGVVITTTSDVSPTVGMVVSATTQAQGQYSYGFDFVTQGYHTIYERTPENFRSTTPDAVPVLVYKGESFTVDFGDCESISCAAVIQGIVFDDATGDGIQQGGELGIQGVTVTLYSGANPIPVGQVNTRSNGDYTFPIPQFGVYRVVETDLPTYHSTTPNEVHISVVVSDTYTANFGDSNDAGVASLMGTVFEDTNVNMLFDQTEVGLPGVQVQILGNTVGSTPVLTTNALGQYMYQINAVGLYTITETDPENFVSTTPNVIYQNALLMNRAYINDFGDAQATTVFTVSGSVWDDTTSPDGDPTGGSPLSGARVAVNTGMFITTTDLGNFTLYAPGTAGTVTATETNPAGYLSTGALKTDLNATVVNADTIRVTSVISGGSSTGNQFGDAAVSGVITVTGRVFNDLNANMLDDDGSGNGLEGVLISYPGGSTRTAADGSFSFFHGPGPFVVTETNPTGFVSTVAIPGSGAVSVFDFDRVQVTASGGSNVSGIKFGDYNGVRITGLVYEDTNANGVFDGADVGISGVLVSASGGLTATTMATGVYTLYAPSGTVTVTEMNPAGYVSTTPDVLTFSGAPGEVVSGKDFGDYNGVRITGLVYEDKNANGVFDGFDVGISGVLVSASGGLTTQTSATGVYTLYGPAGTVIVTETNPAGYVSTTPDVLTFSDVPAGGTVPNADFGDYNGVRITGRVFEDKDANGVFDGADAGIGGVLVSASGSLTTTTTATGVYTLYAPAGTVIVTEANPAGYVSTTPDVLTFSGVAGSAILSNVDFGDYNGVRVTGLVYADTNANGVYDSGTDGVIGNVLVSASGGLTTTTMATGVYTLYAPAGIVIVTETNPAGYVSTTPDVLTFSGTGGGIISGADFGDYNGARITGLVFRDVNTNGVYDGGTDELISNVLVGASGGLTTTTAAATGVYTLYAPSGTVIVTETNPAGYVSTTPDVLTFSDVAGGAILSNVDFGDYNGTGGGGVRIEGRVFNDFDLSHNDTGLSVFGAHLAASFGTTATTHIDGNFVLFAPSDKGPIVITETNPSGYVSTIAIPGTPGAWTVIDPDHVRINTPIISGTTYINLKFGDQGGKIQINGLVFRDDNADGQDNDGQVVPGAIIIATGGTSATTSLSGTFTVYAPFDAGPITITEINPYGYVSTNAIPGTGLSRLNADQVLVFEPIVSGTVYGDTKFGDYFGVMITGTVFNDANANGVYDIGEVGVSSAVITATHAVASATTGSDGLFTLFAPSGAGPITITENDPTGYVSTVALPGHAGVTLIDLSSLLIASPVSGTQYTRNAFGDYNGVRVTGLVYADTNVNGVYDSDTDGVIANVLVSASGGLSTHTSATGVYTLYAPAGTVIVTETNPAGYVSTTPDVLTFSGAPGEVISGKDFGDFVGVQVLGSIFEDRNVNAAWDTTYEPTVTAVSVTLSGSGDFTANTGATGVYTLYAKVFNGSVMVTETVPAGYMSTTPAVLTFNAAEGQVHSSKDFGLLPPACGADTFEPLNDNLSSTTGVTLTPGAPQVHTFHVYDDKDWTKLELTRGYIYTFTASANGARADTVLALFAADGVTQLAQSDDVGSDFSSQINWVAASTDTYYLRATQANATLAGCGATYALSMSVKPTQFLYLPLIVKNY